MLWREKKFEADGARVGHHLVIQRRLRRQLALSLFLGCWQLLLVPRFELRRHAGEQLIDELWLVPRLYLRLLGHIKAALARLHLFLTRRCERWRLSCWITLRCT